MAGDVWLPRFEKPKFWSKNHGPLLGGRINIEKYQLKGLRLIKHSCVVAVRQDQESVSLVKTAVACQLQKNVGGGVDRPWQLKFKDWKLKKSLGKPSKNPKTSWEKSMLAEYQNHLKGDLRNRWDSTRNHVELQ